MMKSLIKTEPKFEPKTVTMDEVENQLDAFIKGVNANAPPAKAPREITQFERISEELANAMVAAFADILTEVENKHKEIAALADKIKIDVRAKAEEYEELVRRARSAGSAILDAHRQFHGEDK